MIMQNAKDTFYITLSTRIAALNSERTVVVRGVTRPGVLVSENELVSAVELPDIFRLEWTALRLDANGALPLAAMRWAAAKSRRAALPALAESSLTFLAFQVFEQVRIEDRGTDLVDAHGPFAEIDAAATVRAEREVLVGG